MKKNKKDTAAQQVIEASLQLVKSGLIARTWGNISCKIDDNFFAITPSGKAYDSLTIENIVEVKIKDLSWSHDLKPSSEKGIHSLVYKLKEDIHFVVHTHQINASALSSLKGSIPVFDKSLANFIGAEVPIAQYALPGTRSLMKNVGKVLKEFSSHAIIMGYHGAVCFGKDAKETFLTAQKLEQACQDFLFHESAYKHKTKITNWKDFHNLFLEKFLFDKNEESYHIKPLEEQYFFDSIREQNSFILLDKNQKQLETFFLESKGEVFSQRKDTLTNTQLAAVWHRAIYNANPKAKAIHHSANDDVMTLSLSKQELFPLLDDFAQIVGVSAKHIDFSEMAYNDKDLKKTMKHRNGFFAHGAGAFVYSSSLADAQAGAMVLQKNSRAFMAAYLLSKKVKFIHPAEAWLMRFVYLKKYSKQM